MNRFEFALLPVALFCVAATDGCRGAVDSVVGASDAGPDQSCSSAGVCNEPNIPVGRHLGEPTCTNVVAECPPVICPDSGATDTDLDGSCPNRSVCSLPVVPLGCYVGVAPCVNGIISDCPPVICPDGGEGDAQDADAGIVRDGSDTDAGPFMCAGDNGSVITCDGRTQYCLLAIGGADGSTHPPACTDLPAACLSDRTCACLKGIACDDNGGDITVTEGLP